MKLRRRTFYEALSIYAAQGLLVIYVLGYYLVDGNVGLVVGTLIGIVLTIGFGLKAKQSRKKLKQQLYTEQWDITKFMFIEKLNLYSKVYCSALVIGLPLGLLIDVNYLAALMVFSFIGLLIFSRTKLNSYLAKQLQVLEAEVVSDNQSADSNVNAFESTN